jgi:hypothetical protein
MEKDCPPAHPILAKALAFAPPKTPFIKRKNLVGRITASGEIAKNVQ